MSNIITLRIKNLQAKKWKRFIFGEQEIIIWTGK